MALQECRTVLAAARISELQMACRWPRVRLPRAARVESGSSPRRAVHAVCRMYAERLAIGYEEARRGKSVRNSLDFFVIFRMIPVMAEEAAS